MRSSWPLVGRDELLRVVEGACGRSDRARGAFLVGGAGVGKTRLVREVVARAKRRGRATRVAVATVSTQGIPLGAFASVLPPTQVEPGLLLARARDALLDVAGSSPVLVAVDDAHLLDDLSAALLHQLLETGAVSVILTARAGEPEPAALTAIWKDGEVLRLDVDALPFEEALALLELVLETPVEQASARRLWRLSEGNPLFMRHLVDGEVAAGRLREDSGLWTWSGSPRLSTTLTTLVQLHVGRLDEATTELVDLVSLDEPLELDVLLHIVPASACESAEAQGVVVVGHEDGQNLVRLVHPLYGEARRAAMGEVRTRRLRGLLVEHLPHQTSVLRRAVLALNSDRKPDPELFSAAAHHAVLLMDGPRAAQLARVAVEAGAGFETQAILTLMLGFTGADADEAAGELERLDMLAHGEAQRVRATVLRASYLAWVAGDPDEAEKVLSSADVEGPLSASEELPLVSIRCMIDGLCGRPRGALRGARVLAQAQADPQSIVMACCGLAAAYASLGRVDELRQTLLSGIDAAGQAVELAPFTSALIVVSGLGLRLAGETREATALAVAAHEQYRDTPIFSQVTALLVGEAALSAGRVVEAVRWLREAFVGLARYAGMTAFRYEALVLLVRAVALTGDRSEARSLLCVLEESRHPTAAILESDHLLARAAVAACEGTVSVAIDWARKAAEYARDAEQPAHEILALQEAAGYGDIGVADRLGTLALEVPSPRATRAARAARALTDQDPEALLDASRGLEDIGDLIGAANAAAHAVSLYAAEQRRGPKILALGVVRRLFEAAAGMSTPAVDACLSPLPLSRREREIANLVAAGHSNREIADRLVLSVRTVEGHLYRINKKLGIRTRDELTRAVIGGPSST